MLKKPLFIFSILIVLAALVLAACTPSATPVSEEEAMPEPTEEVLEEESPEATEEVLEKSHQKPQKKKLRNLQAGAIPIPISRSPKPSAWCW